VGLENPIENQPSDFLPSLLGINMHNPPPFIPLDGLGGTKGESLPTLETYVNSHGIFVDLDSHKYPQSFDVVKYNLVPESRGAPLFLGGVARGLGFLKKKTPNPPREGGDHSYLWLKSK
jgi:hypothetical protein